ncbi:DarT ssDNA thymidine ADP-ribosyltransferase family protein [Burkholderia pseudomallei]|uniref:DarT ssDNA thymidine ADP-ribosyltransferase family protein n=1 Tax=Burkholderia pseudomallei TaxID=28450 RepID=UPI0021F7C3A6|nr:DarT ssDNA thymidine ADP-ribosyltransferase family protein [Burkholderia pseudomallei]MCW0080595.1 DarT ssDNA thymidine ADP-ribosyltransferase family protein [Burkholderia pseudomallei]
MSPTAPPNPTRLYRLLHVDNLSTLLTRGALHSPHSTPDDGLPYRTIHNTSVQENRKQNIFKLDHIRTAWMQLTQCGWMH